LNWSEGRESSFNRLAYHLDSEKQLQFKGKERALLDQDSIHPLELKLTFRMKNIIMSV
jgi:hypothetical protein